MATIQPKNQMNKIQNLVSGTNNSDETVWLKNVKHGTVVAIPPSLLLEKRQQLDAEGNHIYEITEPEFVPKKRINARDDEKKDSANKNANSQKTMTDISRIVHGSVEEIDQYAKENNVDISGLKTKKEKLEKIEAEGKLY